MSREKFCHNVCLIFYHAYKLLNMYNAPRLTSKPNSSSIAMMTSTWSKLSRPRSCEQVLPVRVWRCGGLQVWRCNGVEVWRFVEEPVQVVYINPSHITLMKCESRANLSADILSKALQTARTLATICSCKNV